MSGVVERARLAAERRADALRGEVGRELAGALPGVSQRVEGDAIVLTGRRLVRRWLSLGALRDFRGALSWRR
jgi:hypothetical protein